MAMNDVMKLVKDEQLNILDQNFDNTCTMQLEIRKSSLNTILGKIEKLERIDIKYLFTS
jgi:hypothetical protein